MDRPPSNHQSKDEKGQQYTRHNNDTYRSNENIPLDNRESYDETSYRRNSSGPGGNAYGRPNRYQERSMSPQHAMQFTPSSQSVNYYDQSRNQQHDPRRPRNNYRSNWQSNSYKHHHHQPHHQYQHQQPMNNQQNYDHANYDMWTGYPDQYVPDRSPPTPGSPGQVDSPPSQAYGSVGGNSPKHQSPGRGPRVTINPHPTIHPIPQARPKQPNYKSKLETLCLKNKLQAPQYTAIAAKETKYRCSDFYCMLTIGDEKWKTSPKFYPTKEEAEQMVAKKAFNELFNRHRSTATPEECIEMDREQLVNRVMKILRESNTGYNADGLEKEFKKKYRTELPSDWIDKLTDSSDEVKIEVTQLTNKTFTLLKLMTIPQFQLSEEDAKEEWLHVKVRSANSPNSFWVNLLDQYGQHPEQFTQFSDKMKTFYESSEKCESLTSDKISKRKFAAVQHTAGWARFQVKQVIRGNSVQTDTSGETETKSETTSENGKNSGEENSDVKDKENTQENTNEQDDGSSSSSSKDASTNEPSVSTVLGYLVDFGVKLEIPAECLKVLDDQFYNYPRQAVECSLNLKPFSGRTWTDEAKQQFSSLVLSENCSLCMKIIDKSHMTVDLVDMSDDKTSNIADELIAKNVAINGASSPKSEVNSPTSETTPQREEQTPPVDKVTDSPSEQVPPGNVDSNSDPEVQGEANASPSESTGQQSNESQPEKKE